MKPPFVIINLNLALPHQIYRYSKCVSPDHGILTVRLIASLIIVYLNSIKCEFAVLNIHGQTYSGFVIVL